MNHANRTFDPNVRKLGNNRYEETAEIACRAALVGRMVLSTLHTNTPEGAVMRLTDLGEPLWAVKDVLLALQKNRNVRSSCVFYS